MKFSDYDMAVCLCVDRRYKEEFPRIQEIMDDHECHIVPFIDGKGKLLPFHQYNQISPSPPEHWRHGSGAYAHFHGMKNIIRQAKEAGAGRLLFVEDDLILTPEFNAVVNKVSDDSWDILYYGANHSDAVTEDVSPGLMRVYGSLTTHCMGIRSTIFDAILDLPEVHVIDNVIANSLHHEYRCLAVWPNVALQKPGYSYLGNMQTDYTELFKSRGRNRW